MHEVGVFVINFTFALFKSALFLDGWCGLFMFRYQGSCCCIPFVRSMMRCCRFTRLLPGKRIYLKKKIKNRMK